MKLNQWIKSAESGTTGACVEAMLMDDDYVAVRDSKNPHGNVLVFSAREWNAFLVGVRNSEFDI